MGERPSDIQYPVHWAEADGCEVARNAVGLVEVGLSICMDKFGGSGVEDGFSPSMMLACGAGAGAVPKIKAKRIFLLRVVLTLAAVSISPSRQP